MDASTTAIVLTAHLEGTDDPAVPFAWWAETDDIPRFSAAADSLPELIAAATNAVREIVGEAVEVRFELAPTTDRATGDEAMPAPVPVWASAPVLART